MAELIWGMVSDWCHVERERGVRLAEVEELRVLEPEQHEMSFAPSAPAPRT